VAFARDLLRPDQHTAVRFNSVVSPHRVFDTRRFTLDEFQRISRLVPGATVDDAVLAVCAGGLRRYLDEHGELPEADLAAPRPRTRI
jgi:diacylglycerol O-acyltransferase